ncbi:MAG TPA: FecR domain-containing protein [Verrucomicrobiae bacterium]|nr:FecR domain-containing protein [Verrucomicrobiae bacterium]
MTMRAGSSQYVRVLRVAGCWLLGGIATCAQVQTNRAGPILLPPDHAVILSLAPPTNHGVLVMPLNGTQWAPALVNQVLSPGDVLKTGERSTAVLGFGGKDAVNVDTNTLLRIEAAAPEEASVGLLQGILHLFHRGPPGQSKVRSPTSAALIRGTEFQVQVDEQGATTLTLFDGVVEFTNGFGQLTLRGGQAARTEPGQPPVPAPFLEAVNLLQWRLYYPGVLHLDELRLSEEERRVLTDSLAAYAQGDLLAALAAYPAQRQPDSADEKIYLAALLLSLGRVEQTLGLLQNPGGPAGADPLRDSLVNALRTVIAAVKFQELTPPPGAPELEPSATAALAASYYLQSRSHLEAARAAARRATELAPTFSFAWSRLAELEFGFGRVRAAEQAVEKSLALAPRNAEAIALQGFLLAARDRTEAALASFTRSIAIDGSLGNAWLGRGLCLIRQGHLEAGRRDLLVAAALEPQRAVFRSYLGKAFSESGDTTNAMKELRLARTLDPKDPTAWLYSALLNQQASRMNEAVGDLEKSKELNDNRSVFRSRLLLDQDRAVRGANLAGVYRDAGLLEVGARESSAAVANDYANHSAHLYLANSFSALRDPKLVNLRYETPTFSEYLVANLLAPVGESYLSPPLSQQEYSRFFDRDRLGLRVTANAGTDGSWSAAGTQYGRLDRFGYALDAAYRFDNGHRQNNEFRQLIGSAQFKHQLTPEDSFYFQAIGSEVKSGDVRQYYDDRQSSPTLHVEERQEPNFFAGFHHAWAPGVHTLFLAAHLNDTLLVSEPNAFVRTVLRDPSGTVSAQVDPALSGFGLHYDSEFNAWSAEVQQLWQLPRHTLIAGARFQTGEADTRAVLNRDAAAFPPIFTDPASAQKLTSDLERLSVYGYYHWQIAEPLWLIGGVSYDRLDYPLNVELPPLDSRQHVRDQVSPKAGLLWSPRADTTVRAAYTRSLGGVFYDNSVRLEPTQVAGFIQAYRSLIPESVVGSVPGSRFDTYGIGLDHKFPSRTYLVLDAEWLQSDGQRRLGIFNFTNAFPFPPASPGTTPQTLDYDERSFTATINQLVGESWSFGARYRLSRAELQSDLSEIPRSVDPTTHQDESAFLHDLNLFAIYQHPSGFFGIGETIWRSQSNHGETPAMPGDHFWQLNAFAGYRFLQRRAEVTVGVLNITDQDYHLNPLNLANELPHERTFVIGMKLSF